MLVRGNRSNRSNTYNVQKNPGIFQKVIALAALTALTAVGPACLYGEPSHFEHSRPSASASDRIKGSSITFRAWGSHFRERGPRCNGCATRSTTKSSYHEAGHTLADQGAHGLSRGSCRNGNYKNGCKSFSRRWRYLSQTELSTDST
jgi:hypothetical protein